VLCATRRHFVDSRPQGVGSGRWAVRIQAGRCACASIVTRLGRLLSELIGACELGDGAEPPQGVGRQRPHNGRTITSSEKMKNWHRGNWLDSDYPRNVSSNAVVAGADVPTDSARFRLAGQPVTIERFMVIWRFS